MSKSYGKKQRRERRLRIRDERHSPPDYRKVSRALLMQALAEADAEATAEAEDKQRRQATDDKHEGAA